MHFVVAALGRDCDDFTLHIYASLAEQERKMISERIKAALARSKNKLGLRNPMKRSKAFRRRLRTLSAAALRKAAMERAEAYRVHIEWAFSHHGEVWQADLIQCGCRQAERAASSITDGWPLVFDQCRLDGVSPWAAASTDPSANRSCYEPAYVRVWNQHPEFTARQVVESFGTKCPVGYTRVWKLLRECRLAAAKHSPTQKQMGGSLMGGLLHVSG